MIDVLRDENLKLKNELSSLRSERGSAELIESYKLDISNLQQRNLELEQQISNLSTDLINIKREYDVKLQVYG